MLLAAFGCLDGHAVHVAHAAAFRRADVDARIGAVQAVRFVAYRTRQALGRGFQGRFLAGLGEDIVRAVAGQTVVAQFAAQLPGDVEDGERNAALRAIVSAVRTP